MDIKLRARLSAYTKIESVTTGLNTNIPDPDASAAGHVLGVNNSGQYTLFPRVEETDVDTLFYDLPGDEIVTKGEIDTLFVPEDKPISVTKEDINTLFDPEDIHEVVSKDEIDSLFKSVEEATPVEKEEIDNLFEDVSIGTVSYADIDSLFKK